MLWITSHCFFIYFLCLKLIWYILQPPRIFLGYLDTYPLSFKTVRNKMKRHRTVVGLFYPAYNRHILFGLRPGEVKIYPKTVIFVSDNFKNNHLLLPQFYVSFFSSSETHQSHHLDGCQAACTNSSFISAFWALHF